MIDDWNAITEWAQDLPGWAPTALAWTGRVLGAIAIIVVAWVAARWAQHAVERALSRTRVDRNVAVFGGVATRWLVRLIGILVTLGVFGIETTSIAALVGGAGVGIGLALRGSLANLASGLLLLTTHPFKNGDVIEVEGRVGRVRRVSMFTTAIDTFDNRRVILPNDDVFNGVLENYTHHARRRVDVEIGVAYDADLEEVERVLCEAANAVDEAPEDPMVRCVEFGDSAIVFRVGLWGPSTAYLDTAHALRLSIKKHLDEAGVGIPFPQRTLRFANTEPLEELLAAK